jgi:hypothetical protein
MAVGARRGGPVGSYRLCGLRIASDFELPFESAPVAVDGAAQVAIRRGIPPRTLDDSIASGPTWQMTDQRLLLSIPGIARFLLTGGEEILVDPASDARLDDIPVFLVGTVLGLLLHQRGLVLLHASAVEADGKAIVFCGPSGVGKSTLAAALADRGYPLLTDDLCVLSFDERGVPLAHPDGGRLKLWARAIEALGVGERRGAPVRSILEKYYVEPPAVAGGPLPVARIYQLREARGPVAPGIERANVVDAALLVRLSAYRPLLVLRLRQLATYFEASIGVVRAASVFRYARRMGLTRLPDAVSELEAHWAALEAAA